MKQSTADYMNQLAAELRADPLALEKRFAKQVEKMFAPEEDECDKLPNSPPST